MKTLEEFNNHIMDNITILTNLKYDADEEEAERYNDRIDRLLSIYNDGGDYYYNNLDILTDLSY